MINFLHRKEFMSFIKKFDWVTLPFFSLTLLISIIGLAVYIPRFGIHPLEPVFCFISVFVIAMVVSGGYHRYFSHRTFQCHPILKIFYLVVGAAAFEQSALIWSADHRRHHRYVDTEKDPYNIKKGFWWAHIGWILAKAPPEREDFSNVPDLLRDKWVMWQHRYLLWIAIPMAFGLPLLIGFLMDRPIGMLLWGAFLRIVITHHTTSFINSIAHQFGTQPYTDKNSAKDVWWLAPFLCGETYHNYHHCFQNDYRNGIRWYHWDPTKWALWLLSHTPLVTKLKTTPTPLVIKARVEMDLKRLEQKLKNSPSGFWFDFQQKLLGMRQAVEEAADGYFNSYRTYQEFRQGIAGRSKDSLVQAKRMLRESRMVFKRNFSQWRNTVRWIYQGPYPMAN